MNLKQIEEKIGIAIGEASMCWSETPKGVFDSTNAKRVADNLSNDIMKEITQLLEELREEEWTEDNIPISKMEYEILGLEQIRGKVQEHNRMVEILNSKIDKILNK